MFFNKNYTKYIATVLFIFLFLNSCKGGMIDEQRETVFAVNVSTVNRSSIIDYLELSGDVRTRNEVQVLPDTTGKLTRLLVSLGDRVYQNQVIGYIDPSKPGMNFALSPVKSPISGTVISMPVKIGTTVTGSTPVISVGKLADIEIVTYVSEKYISRIKKGQKAVINVGAYSDTSFSGEVAELSPIVDMNTRMMEIKVRISQNGLQLKPGMFADIKIITEEKPGAIVVPSDAIITRFNNQLVFVKKTVPDEVTNIELDKLLLEKIAGQADKDLLTSFFKPDVPEELSGSEFGILSGKIDLFDKRLKEIQKKSKTKKDDGDLFNKAKEKKFIKKLYKSEGKGKDVKYKLEKEITSEDKKALWDLMVKIEYIFDISREEIKTAEELEKVKSIINQTGYDRGHVEKRIVKTGIETEGKTEILEGLSENEEIIVLGQSLLADNAKIKIMERTGK